MKNLKKVLALVLAFACAFTMFAGAAFSDQADIQSTEAVDALTGLGVIQGYTDGSFRPDVTVTRAEMAKMIFTIINGGNDDASAYENLPTSFTDLTDDWYKGYIKYLQNSGIIAGTSATRFAPNETVTGVEAAKMLLVVAGYDADKAGLTGLSWMANTMKYANLNNLFEDVDADVNAGLPRQYAAQIMYNALDMERVVYSNDIGDFKPAEDVKDDATIGGKYLDLVFEGKEVNDEVYLYSTEKEANRDTYTLDTSDGSYIRVANDYSDLVGQRVVIMHKVNQRNEVYGVYAYEDSTVVANGYVGQLELSGTDKIKLDGTEYKLDSDNNAKGNMIYTANTTTYEVNYDTYAQKVVKGNVDKNYAASPFKLIDNDGDGKVDTAVYTPVKVGKVNAVTSSSVTINGVGTLKFADDTIYDGIAKNDYVSVVAAANNSTDGSIVSKLDVVSGEIDGKRANEARVDGTWYKLATGVSVDTNSTYDLVIVGNTILFADETEGSVKNVAFISHVADSPDTIVGENDVTVKVRMYFPDGTNAEVKISKIDGDKIKKAPDSGELGYSDVKDLAEKMVTYSKLSDDTYDVEAVSDSNLAGTDNFVKGATGVSASSNGAYYDSKINGVSVSSDAVVYVKTGTETKVLSGQQIKDWDKTVATDLNFKADYLVEETNGIDYIQAATLVTSGLAGVPGAADTMYAYAVTDEYDSTLNGEDKIAVDAWNGSEVVTLYADAASFEVTLNAGDLFSYKVNGDYIEDVAKDYVDAAVVGFDGQAEGELKVTYTEDGQSKTNTYTLHEDVIVLTVDDADTSGVDGATLDSIVEAGFNADGTKRIPNIMFMLGTDEDADKVVAVVIDSENNELD